MTITEAAGKLRRREVSAVELARESLAHIRESQARLNAFITVTDETALEQARRADDDFAQGLDRGPLQGIPYALKDNFRTKGIRTTCGSKLFENYIPEEDSAAAEHFRSAGAVLMGKTGMHELAYGITSDNPHFGAVRNPRDISLSPGGSSGGSAAAVAAGLVSFSIGSDTGGSIRIPAAWCGCVGFKPTLGFMDTRGLMPLGPSFDTVGPLTRTVEDAALVLGIRAESSNQTIRVGCAEEFFGAVEWDGAIPVRVPDPGETNAIGRLILLAEAADSFRPWLEGSRIGRSGDFGADVLALLTEGLTIKAADYLAAQRRRAELRREWEAVWQKVDILLTPTVPIGPPQIGGEDVRLTATKLTRPFNVLGFPAASIPLSTSTFGAGTQVVARAGGDAVLLGWASRIHLS